MPRKNQFLFSFFIPIRLRISGYPSMECRIADVIDYVERLLNIKTKKGERKKLDRNPSIHSLGNFFFDCANIPEGSLLSFPSSL
jgi:hypothetical protein